MRARARRFFSRSCSSWPSSGSCRCSSRVPRADRSSRSSQTLLRSRHTRRELRAENPATLTAGGNSRGIPRGFQRRRYGRAVVSNGAWCFCSYAVISPSCVRARAISSRPCMRQCRWKSSNSNGTTRPSGSGDRLRLQVDGQLAAPRYRAHERLHAVRRQGDGKQPDLDAIRDEDVCERRGHHHLEPVVL